MRQVVVVTGGVSAIVVEPVPCAGGETGASRGTSFPSAPLDGSGAACGMPCAVGVSLFVCGGWVMAGGAFW